MRNKCYSVLLAAVLWVSAYGSSAVAQQIQVSPTSFNVTIGEGDTSVQQLVIRNTGGAGLLNWFLEIASVTASATSDRLISGSSMRLLDQKGGSALRMQYPTTGSASSHGSTSALKLGADRLTGSTSILVIGAVEVPLDSSLFKALDQLGETYDYVSADAWATVDLTGYSQIIIGMDGGYPEDADIQAIANAIASGKNVLLVGGTNYGPFYTGMQSYIISHTGATGWTTSAPPHLTVTDTLHPLAKDLPATYTFNNWNASYYMIRLNDPSMETVVMNGDGYPALVQKTIGAGTFTYFINSAWAPYWYDPADFDILKTVVRNSLGITWLRAGQLSGEISPGDSTVVDLVADGRAVPSGFYSAEIRIQSNDPDPSDTLIVVPFDLTVLPPDINVSPLSINVSLQPGDSTQQTITIQNTGVGVLNWGLKTFLGGPCVVSASPVFPSKVAVTAKIQTTVAPMGATSEHFYASKPVPPKGISMMAGGDLNTILTNLESGYGDITSVIPGRYDFSEGIQGDNIDDGGNDMYDGGNYISTNLGGPILYSDGVVVPSSVFGTTGAYFTRKYTGLWVLAADLDSVEYFTISGNLGADGGGSADGVMLQAGGFTAFVKRVFNAGDPSVNHMIIIPDNPAAYDSFATYTDDDFHQVNGLVQTTRIYYLLYAGANGAFIDDNAALDILSAFLNAINPFVSVSPTSGSIPASGNQPVTVKFTAVDLSPGSYAGVFEIGSNDPDESPINVTFNLAVLQPNPPTITVGPDSFVVSVAAGDSSTQVLTIGNTGSGPLTWDGYVGSWDLYGPDGYLNPANGVVGISGSQNVDVKVVANLVPGSYRYYVEIHSDDYTRACVKVPLNITVLPPDIAVTPDSLLIYVRPADSTTAQVQINNTGTGLLSWHAVAGPAQGPSFTPVRQSFDRPMRSVLNNKGRSLRSGLKGLLPLAPGEFVRKADSPLPLTCVAVDPNTNIIYAQENQGNTFYKYVPDLDQWFQLASCPIYSGNNGGAAYMNGKIYTTYTNNDYMGIYDIGLDQWDVDTLAYIQTGNIEAYNSKIYFINEYNFIGYDPVTQTVDTLPHPGFGDFIYDNEWGGLDFYNGHFYNIPGDGYQQFAKYNIVTQQWTLLDSLPEGAVLGSAIDPVGKKLYSYGTYGDSLWYEFDLVTEQWNVTTIPLSGLVNEGKGGGLYIDDGGLAYVATASNTGIYFVQGEGGIGFYLYETEPGVSWLTLNPVDGTVPGGGSGILTVKARPDTLPIGDYYAVLRITSNDPDEASVEVPVHVRVDTVLFSEIGLSQDSFQVAVGYGDSLTRSLTISNTGLGDLDFTVTPGASWLVPGSPGGTVGSGSNTTLDLKMVSTGLGYGVHNTTLTINSNDPDEPTLNVQVEMRILDATPPLVEINFFQDNYVTRQLDVVAIMNEPIASIPVFTATKPDLTAGGVTVDTVDYGNQVYYGHYYLDQTGTYAFTVTVSDTAGNQQVFSRNLTATLAKPGDGGSVSSFDGVAALYVPADALREESYLTVYPMDKKADDEQSIRRYAFGPAGLSLQKPVRVAFGYETLLAEGMDAHHLVIYHETVDGLLEITTKMDPNRRAVWAEVSHLGKFRIRYDESRTSETEVMVPTAFALHQNYPNPFNPTTSIKFDVPVKSKVALVVYNVLGQEVRTLFTGELTPGVHRIVWDGTNNVGRRVSSGVYIYRLKAGSFLKAKKMLLVK
jgi:hypothetical protein